MDVNIYHCKYVKNLRFIMLITVISTHVIVDATGTVFVNT